VIAAHPSTRDQPPTNAFSIELTVAACDIDEQGHASNIEVVRWMSRAAGMHSVSLGYDTPAYERLGAMFVIRRHEIDYLQSAQLGDQLVCHTWPSDLKRATAERRHLVVRPADGAIIARCLNVWAYINTKTGRPQRIPPEVRDAFDPAKFA